MARGVPGEAGGGLFREVTLQILPGASNLEFGRRRALRAEGRGRFEEAKRNCDVWQRAFAQFGIDIARHSLDWLPYI